ncbi:uncharacterized protein odam isoform X2 [Kryptolebias marmoratus]|uniref:uncharacterized protein odam isoform X2 n=1 Tax=Kryptolebias marmoratus TaxID=37003 RepID=UPI0007F86E36|nr:uncharacterized protein odam isoform X2 [Kryptolebias marmoratus]
MSVILTTYCLGELLADYNNLHTENLKGIWTRRGDKKGKKRRETDIMKQQAAFLLICLLRSSFSLPIALIASNSNEILRLNGLTLAALGQTQAASLFPPYVLQQQTPEVLLTPQVVNLNPQVAGPFGPQGPQLLLPNQGNQLTPVLLPNGQQDQLGLPQDPNNPNIPQQTQNTAQMYPQFQYPSFGFPQLYRQQGYPYFYGYPQQRNTAMLPNNAQQNLERTTQRPQLPLQASKPKLQTEKTWTVGTQKESTTIPPDPRGDTTGPGPDEGNGSFPFLFEP